MQKMPKQQDQSHMGLVLDVETRRSEAGYRRQCILRVYDILFQEIIMKTKVSCAVTYIAILFTYSYISDEVFINVEDET